MVYVVEEDGHKKQQKLANHIENQGLSQKEKVNTMLK